MSSAEASAPKNAEVTYKSFYSSTEEAKKALSL
jgi:hypothetical protein